MKAGILSTKTLSPGQKELLLSAGLSLVEQNFIAIRPVEFDPTQRCENILFTSKNAVRIVLDYVPISSFAGKNIFCVGETTADVLKGYGLKVAETAHYGIDLARIICTNYSNQEFLFFCGKKRRSELPVFLRSNGIRLREVIVYDTIPTPKKISRIFEGILFFSPSGVKSYCSMNDLTQSRVFCIGSTTASEVEKFTNRITVAKKPTVENLIVQVVNYFSPST